MRWKKLKALLIVSALAFVQQRANALVTTTILEDFESGGTHSALPATTANSAATANSNSTVVNITESGSKRLKLTDADGGTNGCVLTFTSTIPTTGNYIITADIKVDNSSAAIGSFGMAAVLGNPSTTEVSDTHAGYVMNLTGSGDASLGYQTIGAAINATSGSFPRTLTLYFSTNPSGNSYNAPASDGTFKNNHRTATATWGAGSSDAVYIDNIKLIGPGSFGDDMHFWISAGNSYTNLAAVQRDLDIARNNHFNCIDILARFRSDAYYVPNRDFSTYPNPEPYGTLISPGTPGPQNDPLQYEIDHCREMGMKAYISFSCFLATPNSTYPSYLPTGSQTWVYNSGTPRAQTTADASEGIWADPGRADVRAYSINVMKDIVQNYDIDGIIFDRIRYVGTQFGYNPVALSEMGISGTPSPANSTFVAKRQDAVATFLHDAYEAATDIKPHLIVGTVPIIYTTSLNDTYNTVLQSWPKWSAAKTRNRVLSFGSEDCIQPQAYRSGSTYGPYNSVYLDLARYGDTASYSLDFGLMNGANVNHCPLFYHPNNNDSAQSLLNAQNLCDARQKECNGAGLYAADTVRNDIQMIRTANSGACGIDALASKPTFADFLMKAGYDNTPPNAATGLTVTPNGLLGATLSWTAPTAAPDGELASKYLIYRGTQPGVKEYYSTQCNKATTVTATTYSDTVPASGNFYYRVVPVDDYNNRGQAIEIGPVNITGTAASSTPPAPTNIQVVPFGNVVYITWNDNSGNERTFQLQRDSVTIATLSESVCCYTDNNVAAGSHTYRVRATNSFGNSTWLTASAATTANTVTAPTGLSGTAGTGNASLTWTDTSSNESGVEVLRSVTAGGPYAQVLTIGPGSTSYNDTGLPSSTFYYVVRAFNGLGSSLYSNEVAVTILEATPPAAPSGLTANATGSSITLAWTDNSNNETGFEVRRSTSSGGPYSLIQTTIANAAGLIDSPPATGTYYYVVRAVNGSGSSIDTGEASASVQAPNGTPLNLSASASASAINLNWTDSSTNEAGFEVFRGTAAGGPYSSVKTVAAGVTTCSDTPPVAGTYYYRVRAVNAFGSSTDSNEANATVSAPALSPTGLTAVAGGNNVNLSWTDTTADETGFEIRRSTSLGGPYTSVATTAANAVSYIDSSRPSGTYYYVVRASNSFGVGPDSNEANATVIAVANLIIESRLPSSAGGGTTPAPAYQEFLPNGGSWSVTTAKSTAAGLTGQGGRWTGTGSAGAYAIFTPTIATAGKYDVFITLPNATNGPNNSSPGAGFLIVHDGADITGTFDLTRTNASIIDKWLLLASGVQFAAGTSGSIRITNNNASSADTLGRFDMDAVKVAISVPVTISNWSLE